MIEHRFSGPLSVTIRLVETDSGWLAGLDTRLRNGCGISSPLAASSFHLTRASAIDGKVRWLRRFHGAEVTPALSAWLDSLVPAQPDLFGEAA